MFSLKAFDFDDFGLKLAKYLMFPNSHFCVSEIEFPKKTQECRLQHESAKCFA